MTLPQSPLQAFEARLENIPAAMRNLDQWCVATLKEFPPDKDSKVRRDKRPLDPKTGKPASVVDAATWGTFEQAKTVAIDWRKSGKAPAVECGFILTADDPFSGIDLDTYKGDEIAAQYDDDAQKQLVRAAIKNNHAGLVKAAASYTEISASGKGGRIIGLGSLDVGRNIRSHGIEAYSHGRFLLMTGNAVHNRPPVDISNVLDYISMKGTQVYSKAQLSDAWRLWNGRGLLEGATDERIIASISEAANGSEFAAYLNGKHGKHGSRSEAAYALIQNIVRYTTDRDQFERLLKRTPFWDSKYSKRKDDLHIKEANKAACLLLHDRDQDKTVRESNQRDIEWLRDNFNRAEKPRRGPIPIADKEAVQLVPQRGAAIPLPPEGLLRDLMIAFEAHAQFGLPDAAKVAALSVMAAYCSNSFLLMGSALNLYTIFLGNSAAGKSAAITECIDGFRAAAMMLSPEVKEDETTTKKGGSTKIKYPSPISDSSSVTSVKALMSHFSLPNMSMLFHIEEGTQELSRLFDEKDKNMRQVRTAYLKLFGKGAPGKLVKGITYADGNNTLEPKIGACLNLLYEGTDGTLKQNLTSDLLFDGTMGRFCVFKAVVNPRVLAKSEPLDPELVGKLILIQHAGQVNIDAGDYEEQWRASIEASMIAAHNSEHDDVMSIVGGRDLSRLIRFAGLASIPSDGSIKAIGNTATLLPPKVTPEAVKWAEEITDITTEIMRGFIDAGDFEDQSDDAWVEMITKYVKGYANLNRAAPKGQEKFKKLGIITDRLLHNNLRTRKLFKNAGNRQAIMWREAIGRMIDLGIFKPVQNEERELHELGSGRMWRYSMKTDV